jgi:hypothetical protein
MREVVYNSCHGGFSLSRAAVLRARELSCNPQWGGACIKGDAYSDGTACDYDYGSIEDIKRHDRILVQVIKELGQAANGDCAKLKIETVPVGTAYRIDEYDGYESVMTAGDYQWEIAE